MVPCKVFPHEGVPDWNSFGTYSRVRRSADKDPTDSIRRPLRPIQAQIAGITLIRDRQERVILIVIVATVVIAIVAAVVVVV